jgi:molecular chaperone GrpE (heat shock protein)
MTLCELYYKISAERSGSEIDLGYGKYIELIRELTDAAKILTTYYEKNRAILENLSEHEIISGINETVAIKVENLTEAQAELLAAKSEIVPESVEREKASNSAEIILKAWNDGYVSFGEKTYAPRKIEGKTLKLRKKLDEFLKTKVFSEIISLEEIENYSVPKLQESDDPSTADYLSVFNEAIDRINKILDDRGIMRIAPNPRDQFEAQYHEILLAESREGFSKGEIIKLVSKGFMEGDKVYIRANVIASR